MVSWRPEWSTGRSGVPSAVAERARVGGTSQAGRAGIVSPYSALTLDLVVVVLIDMVLNRQRGRPSGRSSLRSVEVAVPPPPFGYIIAALLLVSYMVHGWTLGGRTLGMILLGLRAVREDGGDIKLPRAVVRALAYLVFPPGILWAAVSSKNASLQDLIVDTAVVYDRGHARTSSGTPVARAVQVARRVDPSAGSWRVLVGDRDDLEAGDAERVPDLPVGEECWRWAR